MNAARRFKHSDQRKRLYTLLSVAKRELEKVRHGFCEEDYRHILAVHGATEKNGQISATTMSTEQLQAALDHCHDLGFKISTKVSREQRPNRSRKSGEWRRPRIGKLNALWCALADAGVVNDRSEKAMQQYCLNNVPELSRFEWISSEQLNTAIEMMKKMFKQRGIDSYNVAETAVKQD